MHGGLVMKILLLSDDAIRLEPIPGALTIEAASPEMSYSPFHMLASGLATCTVSVLHSWATHAKIPVADLTLEVRWRFGAAHFPNVPRCKAGIADGHRRGALDLCSARRRDA